MSPLDAGLAEPDPMDVLAAEMRTNEEMHEVLLMLVGTVFALLSKDGEDEWADSMRADLWEYRDEVHAACEKWDFYRNSDSQFPISALSAVDPKILSKMLAEGHAFAYENVGEGGPKNADEAVLEACERRRPVLLESPKASASRDVYNILMKGLRVPDRLHRFSADEAGKLSQVAKSEARFW